MHRATNTTSTCNRVCNKGCNNESESRVDARSRPQQGLQQTPAKNTLIVASEITGDASITAKLAELNGLIARIARDNGFADADVVEATETAITSIDDALRCFRALVAAMSVISVRTLPAMPDTDDRVTCGQCSNLAGDVCRADGKATVAELMRRCEGFKPKARDPDQRAGRERWPGLREVEP